MQQKCPDKIYHDDIHSIKTGPHPHMCTESRWEWFEFPKLPEDLLIFDVSGKSHPRWKESQKASPSIPHFCLQPTPPLGAFTPSKVWLKSSLKVSSLLLAQLIRVSRPQMVNSKCQETQHWAYKKLIWRPAPFTQFIYSGFYWHESSI